MTERRMKKNPKKRKNVDIFGEVMERVWNAFPGSGGKSDEDKGILVIGSCQHGKSTLCNFLHYGDDINGKPNHHFRMGTGFNACTRDISMISAKWERTVAGENGSEDKIIKRNYNIPLIDTPGIGDTEEKDEENMMQFYRFIDRELVGRDKKVTISSVLLVLRYPVAIIKTT